MILHADLIVQLVLLGLVFMSFACWAIIFQKYFRLRSAAKQSAKFLDLFWSSKRLDAVYEKCGSYRKSPVAEVFRAGYQELAKITAAGAEVRADATDNLSRTLRRATAVESTNLERWVAFLGTTGSTAPFIGLFGTVWGILRAFQKLGGGGAATIDVVGPDIAHALIATAVGLAAAIPAVIAFNYFNTSIRVLNTEMDNFSADFLNIVKRHLR
ncbi:MAG: protein TolQ [Alphaproteobacteria bacterium]|nr:protein TolQ [Alphaproteobacteria bacterium]MCB9697871.1 protein TolQ [Alphaproteobacteria bacterium]